MLTHGKAGAASCAALRGACSPLALSVGCGMLFAVAWPDRDAGAGDRLLLGHERRHGRRRRRHAQRDLEAGGTTLSTDSTGATATGTVTTTTADRLFFSAGTDATGSYTVTVSGTQNIGRLTFQEGTVTLTRRHDQFRRRVRPHRWRWHAGQHLGRHCRNRRTAFQRRHGHADRRDGQHLYRHDAGGWRGAGPGVRDPRGAGRERYQRKSSCSSAAAITPAPGS